MRDHQSGGAGRGAVPWLLLAAGELLFAGLAALPDARARPAPYLLLFAASALLALKAARSLSGSPILFLLLCGGLFRATLLFRAPDLSDDVYRFAFDGRVAAAGISPYLHAPEDPAVAGVAPDLLPRVAHRSVKTVYPPVAQAVFRAAAFAAPHEVLALKVLFGLADLAVVLLLSRLGGTTGGFAAALYAFHPLAVTETAGQGHPDALGVALLLASLLFLAAGRRARAGAAFTLAVLAKYVPAAGSLPLLRRGRAVFGAAALGSAAVIWWAAARGGASPAGGLSEYATRWSFNSVVYAGTLAAVEATELPERSKGLFLQIKEGLGHPAWTQEVFPYFYAAFFARALLGIVLAILLLGINRRFREGPAETPVFASLAALTLLAPTLHPWYLLWLLPFAARARQAAFLWLASAAPLAYALLYPIPWLPAPLVYGIEFGPFAVLLAAAFRRRGLPAEASSSTEATEDGSAKAGEGRA
jgi:Glycosyltransferase family 87